MPYVLFGLLMIGLILVYPGIATFLPRSVANWELWILGGMP